MAYVWKFYNGTSWVPAVRRYWTGSKWVGVDGAGDVVPHHPYVQAVLDDSPTGYWKFDEGSGTTAADSSGNGNDATYHNTPNLTVASFITGETACGTASGVVEGVDGPGFPAGAPETFELWVYNTSAISAAGPLARIVDGIGNESSNYYGAGNYTGSLTNEIISLGSATNTHRTGWTHASESLAIGWHHHVWIWTGTEWDIYVDTVQRENTTVNAAAYYSAVTSWQLGHRDADSTTSAMDLRFAHFAVYDGVLSTARIQAHYNAGVA